METIIQRIARLIAWNPTTQPWTGNRDAEIQRIQREYLPYGSGIDTGCCIDLDRSKPNSITILFEYHHMDEHGFYCGWSHWQLIVTPDLADGFRLRIQCVGHKDLTWELRNMVSESSGIRDYFHDIFQCALESKYSQPI